MNDVSIDEVVHAEVATQFINLVRKLGPEESTKRLEHLLTTYGRTANAIDILMKFLRVKQTLDKI